MNMHPVEKFNRNRKSEAIFKIRKIVVWFDPAAYCEIWDEVKSGHVDEMQPTGQVSFSRVATGFLQPFGRTGDLDANGDSGQQYPELRITGAQLWIVI